MSLTKNRKDEDTLNGMIQRAFPGIHSTEIIELKEGFFNVAYRITLSDKQEVILKIAPPKEALIMSYEKNIMYSEVEALRLIRKNTQVPVPEVLFYDASKDVCDSDYFFMNVIEGESLNEIQDTLSEEVKDAIQDQAGVYNYQMNQITGEVFGYYGQQQIQGNRWFDVFKTMIEMAFADAEALNIVYPIQKEKMMELYDRDRAIFEEVTVPKFVHWDLWAGNIFIKDNEISGIIDFERCIWGDELMEVGFRCYDRNPNFLRGYGITGFTESQERRARWYDIYLFQVMLLECDYRGYETKDMYHWAYQMIKECINAIQ